MPKLHGAGIEMPKPAATGKSFLVKLGFCIFQSHQAIRKPEPALKYLP
jgi:hypothetical protein